MVSFIDMGNTKRAAGLGVGWGLRCVGRQFILGNADFSPHMESPNGDWKIQVWSLARSHD